MFDAQTYIKRREKLKKNLGSGVILLLGNEECSVNYADNWYPFRQDSTFLYYFGLNKPHLAAIIDLDEGEELLFGDDPGVDDIVWTGPVPSLIEQAEHCGIDSVQPYDKVGSELRKMAGDQKIHVLPPYRPEHTLKLQKWLGLSLEGVEKNVSVELIKTVVSQRSYKTKEEITLLEEAVNITGQMHLEAMRSARPGMKEYELMSRVHQKALEQNGQLAFPIILTKNGHILHNHYHGNTISEGDMVLCDAGAEHQFGYAGDITRTFPVGKKFTDRQKKMYEIVLKSQKSAVEALKPGIRFREVHTIACLKLAEGLKEVGLMKGNEQDAVVAGAHTLFFQCGLGHMMGLDVHDMENLGEEYVGYTDQLKKSKEFGLKSLRLGRELEPGFVVTVEPGIYFIPELIDLWAKEKKHSAFINYERLEEFRNFGGIRVEDDYVITSDGYRLLGDPIPKTITEIEGIRKKALI